MKLIIEKHRWSESTLDVNLYAYFVDEEQFKKTEKDRKKLKKLSPRKTLSEECNLRFLPEDSYLVFDLHPLCDFIKNED